MVQHDGSQGLPCRTQLCDLAQLNEKVGGVISPHFQPPRQMEELARGFRETDRSGGQMQGCVGCLDGIAIRIRRPCLKDDVKPAAYLNRCGPWPPRSLCRQETDTTCWRVDRKGFFSVNAQAICDSKKKFTWVAMNTAGATHDELAWCCTEMGLKIKSGDLPDPYYIGADAAYVACDAIITPFSGCYDAD